jgi:ferric-dicitrate binding protein FerR (iron transport regulator)
MSYKRFGMELHKMPDKLFVKKLLGIIDPVEEKELQRLMDEHPEVAGEFKFTEGIWHRSKSSKIFEQIDTKGDWKNLKNQILVSEETLSWKGYLLRIAAIMILTAGLSAGFYKIIVNQHSDSTEKYTNYTAENQKRQIILPDGSTVVLNAGSELSYAKGFGSSSRDVNLKGEAYFNVIPGLKLPFRVFSGGSVVQVTGTSFSVYQVDGEVHVSVITGKVMLSSTVANSKSISIPANNSGYVSEKNEVTLEEGIPDNALSWKTGRLFFDDTPIDSALIDIARYFRRDLSIEAPVTDRITAEFQNQPMNEILNEINMVAGLKFDTTGTALIVSK